MLDLRDVSFMDSSGLRLILAWREEAAARTRARRSGMIPGREVVERVFDTTAHARSADVHRADARALRRAAAGLGTVPLAMRRTKIVATIGPASRDPEVLVQMIDAGMDVARLNFSHGSAEEHAETAQRVRDAANRAGPLRRHPAGPARARSCASASSSTGSPSSSPATRSRSSAASNDAEGDAAAHVHHLGRARRHGRAGRDHLPRRRRRAAARSPPPARATARSTRWSRSAAPSPRRQGLNIPGETAALPSVPEEDIAHLATGEKIGVDLVALSFVRRAEDVESRAHSTPGCR